MQLLFKQAQPEELEIALSFLKLGAELLKTKNIDQWNMWLSPSADHIRWIKEGFENKEFYFVEHPDGQRLAMFRLSEEDLLYWGETQDKANYIHSLVVDPKFSGKDLGKNIIVQIQEGLIRKGISLLRLDCKADNKWLCAYYEQQGFVKAGEKLMPHGLNNLYEKQLV